MPNTKRGFGSAGLIIVILIIIAGGAYLWSQKSPNDGSPTSSVVLSPKAGDNWVIGETHTIKLAVDPQTIAMVQGIGLARRDGSYLGTIDCLKYADQRKEFTWDGKTVLNYCGAGSISKNVSLVPGEYRVVLSTGTIGDNYSTGGDYFTISR
ncbi:MAG: hypothetical protein AAB415_01885 [Patescibacteria group bacterium]